MPPSADPTRQRLIAAAEALFAEHGIEAVPLRQITLAAGQRNANALQYHFTDRQGLARAVLHKHYVGINAARHKLLDEYEATGALSDSERIRSLAGALTRPAAAKLNDPDGGRNYLRIVPQLLDRPSPRVRYNAEIDPADSIYRWRSLVGEVLPELAVVVLHRRFTAIRFMAVELGRRAAAPTARDDRLFTSHLIDLIASTLDAPISYETRQLLAERAAAEKNPIPL